MWKGWDSTSQLFVLFFVAWFEGHESDGDSDNIESHFLLCYRGHKRTVDKLIFGHVSEQLWQNLGSKAKANARMGINVKNKDNCIIQQ